MADEAFDRYLSEINNGYFLGGRRSMCVAGTDCFSRNVKLCGNL